jgi:hypothetical protein
MDAIESEKQREQQDAAEANVGDAVPVVRAARQVFHRITRKDALLISAIILQIRYFVFWGSAISRRIQV